jgi:FAD/FMN-containing dehydrogenase
VTGIGVAGFTLGGGYSWKTNQYGLSIDTVQSFELVLPNGTVTTVTATSNADLFFGLRGGFNNFGIVTKFVLKTFPQTQVWGGAITYGNETLDKITAATNKFSDHNTDPKANIITSYTFSQGQAIVSLLVFYDAPTPPSGLFDDFLAITPLAKDISTRSFKSLVQSSQSNSTAGFRGAFHTVSLTGYPVDLLNFIVKQLIRLGTSQTLQSEAFIVYAVEPFLPSLFSHSTSPSAYPPNRSQGLLPLNLDFGWTDPSMDDAFHKAIRHSAASIKAKAIADGQDVASAALYGNYAISDTPLKDIYGSNLARLKRIKETYDPRDVMGLAGGFKF